MVRLKIGLVSCLEDEYFEVNLPFYYLDLPLLRLQACSFRLVNESWEATPIHWYLVEIWMFLLRICKREIKFTFDALNQL